MIYEIYFEYFTGRNDSRRLRKDFDFRFNGSYEYNKETGHFECWKPVDETQIRDWVERIFDHYNTTESIIVLGENNLRLEGFAEVRDFLGLN